MAPADMWRWHKFIIHFIFGNKTKRKNHRVGWHFTDETQSYFWYWHKSTEMAIFVHFTKIESMEMLNLASSNDFESDGLRDKFKEYHKIMNDPKRRVCWTNELSVAHVSCLMSQIFHILLNIQVWSKHLCLRHLNSDLIACNLLM